MLRLGRRDCGDKAGVQQAHAAHVDVLVGGSVMYSVAASLRKLVTNQDIAEHDCSPSLCKGRHSLVVS
jgi:hypothetical protein